MHGSCRSRFVPVTDVMNRHIIRLANLFALLQAYPLLPAEFSLDFIMNNLDSIITVTLL